MHEAKEALVQLQESLYYLHVDELKQHCATLQLSERGKKAALVARIMYYLATGKKTELPAYPKISCGRPQDAVLAPDALMLKGAYKNDLKTRLFFKSLIGEYFHFIAFGIDWLEERWLAGMPPTYREFAAMWQEQYHERKLAPAAPKTEWAYIRFVQGYMEQHPHADKGTVLHAWEAERERHVALVVTCFKVIEHYHKA